MCAAIWRCVYRSNLWMVRRRRGASDVTIESIECPRSWVYIRIRICTRIDTYIPTRFTQPRLEDKKGKEIIILPFLFTGILAFHSLGELPTHPAGLPYATIEYLPTRCCEPLPSKFCNAVVAASYDSRSSSILSGSGYGGGCRW